MADPSKQQRLVIHLDGGLVQAVYTTGGQDLSEVFAELLVVDTDTDGCPDEDVDAIAHRADPDFPGLGVQKHRAFIHGEKLFHLPEDCDLSALLGAWDAQT